MSNKTYSAYEYRLWLLEQLENGMKPEGQEDEDTPRLPDGDPIGVPCPEDEDDPTR